MLASRVVRGRRMTPRRAGPRRIHGAPRIGPRVALGLLAALVPAALASAQTAPPPVLAPPTERITVPPPPRPELRMPAPEAPVLTPPPPGAEAVRLVPRAILVEGATAILPGRIEAETSRLIGREVTVAEIFALAQRLEQLYLDAGFFLSRVVVPPQRVENGVVRIRAIEGSIAEIEYEGDIGPAIAQVRAFLAPLLAERPLSVATLERALLLANDIPGVTAAATLRPGTTEGAPLLSVSVSRKPYDGVLVYDNRGSRLQGPTQLFAIGGLNSFTRFGERTELLIVTTALRGQPEQRREQNFAQLNLSGYLGGSGLALRAFAGVNRTEPGTPLAEIGYRGNVFVAGIGASYPIIRSRATTLTVTGQFDIYNADSQEDAQRALQQRTEARYRTARFGLEASFRDEWLGITGMRATFHRGIDGFRASPNDITALVPRPGAEPGFIKWTGEVSRLQALFSAGRWAFDLLGVVAGQYTNDLLPQQEKFFLGGDRLGRGFYAGEVTGDRAVIGSVELRATSVLRLTEADADGLPVQFYGFVDLGRAWDRAAPGLPTPAAIPMRSAGLGVRMDIRSWLTFELEGVRRFTREFAGANVQPLSMYAGFFRLTGRF
jgi:hemolysin activation/secretion protein